MKTVVRLAAIVCALPALSIAGCGARGAFSGHNAPGSGGAANPNSTIPSQRSIQEADIYKLVGNTDRRRHRRPEPQAPLHSPRKAARARSTSRARPPTC